MKEKNKIALLIVAGLGIILIAGQIFLSSKNNATVELQEQRNNVHSETTAKPTEVIHFVPNARGDEATQSGSCWTNSIAAPYRSDAWRCAVGNSINDPCFEISDSKDLLCGINPAASTSEKTFVLKLTSSLPLAEVIPGGAPRNWAWLIELENGTLCSPFTGTRPFTAEGDSANYGCAPGPLGSDVLIFGDLDASNPSWTATIGTLKTSASGLPTLGSSTTIAIAKAWQ